VTEAEWAWAAGLFEGEGTILASLKNGRWRKLELQLKMTDEDVVRRFHSIVGGRMFGPYQYQQDDGSHRKEWWLWRSDGVDPARILRTMWPWLGVRRRARAEELGVLAQLGLGFPIVPRGTS
jgi:hypothetical protein